MSLEDDLGSKGTPERAKFKVKTLEPLETGQGIYLPSGAEIEGHVSHVESAGAAGRGETFGWTFDDIQNQIRAFADRRGSRQRAPASTA